MYWTVLEEAVDQKVWRDQELADDIGKRNKKTRAAEKEKYKAPIEDLTRRWNLSRKQRAKQFTSLDGASEVAAHVSDPTTESLKSAPASPLPLPYFIWVQSTAGSCSTGSHPAHGDVDKCTGFTSGTATLWMQSTA